MMSPIELALRTGTVAILLLGRQRLMLRDRRRLESGPYSGLMALSVAADTVMSITGYDGPPWLRPLQLIAAGTSAMMWIWIGALFIDGYRPSWRAAVAWAVLPALELVGIFVWFPWMGRAQEVLSLLFVLLAGWRAVAGLRGDLVERRRRLRPVLATLAVLYSVGIIVGHALDRDSSGGPPIPADRTLEAAGLAALSVCFAVLALRAGQPIFAAPPPQVAPAPVPPADDDAEAPVLARLLALMEQEKIYRREGFDLGALVAALDLPEYRLRRLINQRLGHRNFSSFVNSYRLAEARSALADPAQASVPVLTIALDAGFQSIGPFNRAFKAETGLTPTEYRRQAESRNGARAPCDLASAAGSAGRAAEIGEIGRRPRGRVAGMTLMPLLTWALPAVIVLATAEALVLTFVAHRPYNWRSWAASLTDALARDYLVGAVVTEIQVLPRAAAPGWREPTG